VSERGSFVTEYIYCDKCFSALKKALIEDGYGDHASVLLGQSAKGEFEFPIIAGKVDGLYSGEEIHGMEYVIEEYVQPNICHPVRICVLADTGGEQIFHVKPSGSQS
jgi:hypothetical protein